jgi:hypothetical protein
MMFGGALPRSRSQRWTLLEQFLARWFPPFLHPGVRPSELDSASERLGLPLPVALREWYQRQGARADVWSRQDRWLSPRQFEVADDLLIFCRENQAVVQWGIAVKDLSMADPPVILSHRHGPTIRHTEHETTSGFALAFAVMNAKWSTAAKYRANGEATDEACQAIRSTLPRLPFPDLHWPGSPTYFHADDDIVVEIQSATCPWVWAVARTAASLEKIDALVRANRMDWQDLSD